MGEQMSIFLDTSFLIACTDAKDQNYPFAQKIKKRIENLEFGQCFVSDYIFDEFVTFLRAKKFPEEIIRERGNALVAEEPIRLIHLTKEQFSDAWDFFKKSTGVSFTDCTSIIVAKEYGIKIIASFDTDFDKRTDLKRVFL